VALTNAQGIGLRAVGAPSVSSGSSYLK